MVEGSTAYNPQDLIKIWQAGAKFGTYKARNLNFSSDFTITEDDANNRYDIDVSIPAAGLTNPLTVNLDFDGHDAQHIGTAYTKGTDGSNVKIFSGANSSPNQHVHFYPDHVKQVGSTDDKIFFGFNGEWRFYSFHSKQSGTNTEYFQIDAVNSQVNALTKFAVGANKRARFDETGLTAVRNFTFPDSDGQLALTGGTFDPSTETIVQDPITKRTGYAIPVQAATPGTAANIINLAGCLTGTLTPTGGGTNTQTLDTTNGFFSTFVSAGSSGAFAGLVPVAAGAGLCNTTFGGKIRGRFKIDSTTSARLYFGLGNSNALAAGDTPMASISTMMVGFTSASGWQVFHNNNSGSGTADNLTGSPARDANWNTVEINWPDGGASFNAIFNGTSQSISTDIPTTGDPLWLYLRSENTSTTARNLSVKGVWTEFNK